MPLVLTATANPGVASWAEASATPTGTVLIALASGSVTSGVVTWTDAMPANHITITTAGNYIVTLYASYIGQNGTGNLFNIAEFGIGIDGADPVGADRLRRVGFNNWAATTTNTTSPGYQQVTVPCRLTGLSVGTILTSMFRLVGSIPGNTVSIIDPTLLVVQVP